MIVSKDDIINILCIVYILNWNIMILVVLLLFDEEEEKVEKNTLEYVYGNDILITIIHDKK